MPLRSCCLTLAGSRVCALALLRDRSASACAFRQAEHLQPLVHRARVPWPYLALTRVRVATSALALAYVLDGTPPRPRLLPRQPGRFELAGRLAMDSARPNRVKYLPQNSQIACGDHRW